MTTRVLPYNEWHKLEQTSAKDVWRSFQEGVQIPVVIERDGEIIGQIVLIPVLHAECAGVTESERGGLAFGKLWQATQRIAREEFHVRSVWASALEEPMLSIIEHLSGTPVPGLHALVKVGD